jgi:hypothetical protein
MLVSDQSSSIYFPSPTLVICVLPTPIPVPESGDVQIAGDFLDEHASVDSVLDHVSCLLETFAAVLLQLLFGRVVEEEPLRIRDGFGCRRLEQIFHRKRASSRGGSDTRQLCLIKQGARVEKSLTLSAQRAQSRM